MRRVSDACRPAASPAPSPDPAPPRLLPLGDAAWTVEFGRAIDPAAQARVLHLAARVRAAGRPEVVDVVPSLRSLTVHLDPLAPDAAELGAWLLALAGEPAPPPRAGRCWRLPVCFEADCAPDLPALAQRLGLTPDAVIARLTGTALTVGMIGFMPGFPYMTGLPEALAVPRRATPRTRVPAGSVAVAGGLCGVYPWESPGGWWLVGHLPLPLFEAGRDDDPAWLAAGDRVRWVAVGARAHAALARDWARDGQPREPFLDGAAP